MAIHGNKLGTTWRIAMFLLSGATVIIVVAVIVFLSIIFVFLLLLSQSTKEMTKAFDRLQIGMTYQEVKSIMGEPKSEHRMNNGSIVCTWRKAPFHGYHVIRNAYFVNGKLDSVSSDKSFS